MDIVRGEILPMFFAAAADFRAWLADNAATASQLTVGFHKVGSGKARLLWPESVDEALCFGWIDGVRKRIDDHSYQIRFTPRKKGSIWSAVNIARANALIAAGRMRPAGLEVYKQRTQRKSKVYSYEQAGSLRLHPDEVKTFKKHTSAWVYFESAPPSYRKTMIHWVVSAKRQETRQQRLAKFIESCAAGVDAVKKAAYAARANC